jgi:hypothetical protein
MTFDSGPVFPGGVGEGSTLDMAVLGIEYHWPMASALTHVGSCPGGSNTDTTTDALAVPFAPVQARLNAVVLVRGAVASLPEVAFSPDQPPEAVQEVALVEDHVRVDTPPLAMEIGFAVIETVGAGGGGGVAVTLTWADALALPPSPLQVSEKVLLVLSAPVDWLPEVALEPDHPPEAVQDDALVEDHVSVDAPPLTTDVGFAVSDTVGAGGGDTGGTDGPDGADGTPPVSRRAGDSLSPPPQATSTSAGTSNSPIARKIGPRFLTV